MHEALWQSYFESPCIATRNRLIEAHMPIVGSIARRLNRPDHVELDDLVSEGVFGLVRAIEGFDPLRGMKFTTYSFKHIHGAMQDYLRSSSWFKRSSACKQKRMTSIHRQWKQDDFTVSLDEALADPKSQDDHKTIEKRDEALRLIQFAGDAQRRRMLELYYLEDLTMKQAGAALGVSESYVSILHKDTIASLQERSR